MKILFLFITVMIILKLKRRIFGRRYGWRRRGWGGPRRAAWNWTKGVKLSEEQQNLKEEFDAKRRSMHQGYRRKRRPEHVQTVIDFVEGDISREDVHQTLKENQEVYAEGREETKEAGLKFLDSLTTEQKEKVLENLKKKEKLFGKRFERMSKYVMKMGPGRFLFRGMDLSKSQKGRVESIKNNILETYGFKNLFDEEVQDLLERFASNRVDITEVDSYLTEKLAELSQKQHEHADEIMDFLETLSEDQAEQLVENLLSLEEKVHYHRRGYGRGCRRRAA